MATHSRILAWKIPWTEEPGRLQSMGSQRVREHTRSLPITKVSSNYLGVLECKAWSFLNVLFSGHTLWVFAVLPAGQRSANCVAAGPDLTYCLFL